MPPATRCTSHTLAAPGCAVLRRNLGSSWQQHSQGLSLKEAVKSGMWGTSHPHCGLSTGSHSVSWSIY